MSVSVTEETVTSNVEISTEGSLKVKKLVSENGEIEFNAKKTLTIEEIQAKRDAVSYTHLDVYKRQNLCR